jgi:hypothetical protein
MRLALKRKDCLFLRVRVILGSSPASWPLLDSFQLPEFEDRSSSVAVPRWHRHDFFDKYTWSSSPVSLAQRLHGHRVKDHVASAGPGRRHIRGVRPPGP